MPFLIAKKILTSTMVAIGAPITVDMKLLRYTLLAALFALPLFGSAQKAYETVHYQGTVNGMLIRFTLADGYLGASKIQLSSKLHTKVQQFIPEKGVADAKQHLKFLTYPTPNQAAKNHFVLAGMQTGYTLCPTAITGKYYSNGKTKAITLQKEKP